MQTSTRRFAPPTGNIRKDLIQGPWTNEDWGPLPSRHCENTPLMGQQTQQPSPARTGHPAPGPQAAPTGSTQGGQSWTLRAGQDQDRGQMHLQPPAGEGVRLGGHRADMAGGHFQAGLAQSEEPLFGPGSGRPSSQRERRGAVGKGQDGARLHNPGGLDCRRAGVRGGPQEAPSLGAPSGASGRRLRLVLGERRPLANAATERGDRR